MQTLATQTYPKSMHVRFGFKVLTNLVFLKGLTSTVFMSYFRLCHLLKGESLRFLQDALNT